MNIPESFVLVALIVGITTCAYNADENAHQYRIANLECVNDD